MSEHRFYSLFPPFICPLCSSELVMAPRKSQPDSMKLMHLDNECVRSGKVYYCPRVEMLTEIPEEFQ